MRGGGGVGNTSPSPVAASPRRRMAAAVIHHLRHKRELGSAELLALRLLMPWERPDSVSRLSRFRSARKSPANGYRRLPSLSRHLLIILSSSYLISGFSRTGHRGERFKMASQIAAVLSPLNGNCPVAISYKTTPQTHSLDMNADFLPRQLSIFGTASPSSSLTGI